ncbi:hypothetical protein Q5P01_000281 [Channa striata]|uniref:Uncharacterized protein n=1 Tax=Channa striata TaxID=64152 RepID=A0AA88IH88_CHASR|nr:hypothetical protein Q5P01_000281 [Channa striata]
MPQQRSKSCPNDGERTICQSDMHQQNDHHTDQNQTVFLHLTSLRPEDSGNYTCECSHLDGINVTHLSITVEDDRDPSSSTKTGALIAVTVVIIIAGLIVGFIQWTNRHSSRTGAFVTSGGECYSSVHHDDLDDPYSSLQHPTNDLYQKFSSVHCQPDTRTKSANNQELDGGETDPSKI